MSEDLTVKMNAGKLNIRVGAWIVHDDNLLVSQFPDGTISLPGGRVQLRETSIEAIEREIMEETGMQLDNPKLFAVIENFFLEKEYFHEFLFIYRGQIPIQPKYYGQDSSNQIIKWIPLTQVNELKPDILVKLSEIVEIEELHHFTNIEAR
ncbi:NUDIX hydrolase [Lysinibacillus xylanilyticus]|uniref:NUDIX hydrolase n=1 Tax=Lysinibacillus xylanilyticus TaxID=582475 RepID=UPI002B254487|nr:NUDIX domain-containing protein [Lysinibacillus xylanilyticus]